MVRQQPARILHPFKKRFCEASRCLLRMPRSAILRIQRNPMPAGLLNYAISDNRQTTSQPSNTKLTVKQTVKRQVMKKIINGKRYDTKTATEIRSEEHTSELQSRQY